MNLLLLAGLFTWPLQAIEIATGKMLGAGHDARAFYGRNQGGAWSKTYSGLEHRAEAAGRLMNLRIAQALFHDEWMTEAKFDPEAHTRRVIAALDTYREHGILAINVSLQGGNPAYELTPNIRRDRPYKLGAGKGSLISAFRPDGSMKEAWVKRLDALVSALDQRGMVLNLLIFYQHQDELFENTAAIDRAAQNAAGWLLRSGRRNVMIEIANEHDAGTYDHGRYIHEKMGHLIRLVRRQFEEKRSPWRPPISASTIGGRNMTVFDGVRDQADLVIIHGNGRTPEEKRNRTTELAADPSMPGPIYMDEDNNGRDTTPAILALELASCDAVFDSGGSWGYMPWRQLQIFPFRHIQPARSTQVADNMAVEQRDPAYFHAVLDHIRRRLLRPEAAARACTLSK